MSFHDKVDCQAGPIGSGRAEVFCNFPQPRAVSRLMARKKYGLASRLRRDSQGQIIVVTAATLAMLGLLLGFVVDFSRSQAVQSKLSSIADAAALAAVDNALISQPDTTAVAASTAIWNSQAGALPDLSSVTMTPVISTTGGTRTMTITWSANSKNFFANLLGIETLRVSGSSSASAHTLTASADYYVVLDNSPSMLLPSTSQGITALQTTNGNCAFSCHITAFAVNAIKDSGGFTIFINQSFYNNGVDGGINGNSLIYKLDTTANKIYDYNGTFLGYAAKPAFWLGTGFSIPVYRDLYSLNNHLTPIKTLNVYYADAFWLAENFGKAYPSYGINTIRLRIDDMQSAIKQLLAIAQSQEAANQLIDSTQKFSMQFFLMNMYLQKFTATMTDVKNITSASLNPSTGTFAPYLREQNNFPSSLTDTSYPGLVSNEGDSRPSTVLSQLLAIMPTPGTGIAGSAPQQVVVIVTDGMYNPGSGSFSEWDSATLSVCDQIKSHGAKIAILYTVYDPATAPSAAVTAATAKILPALQSCASTVPGSGNLVISVKADGDISAALSDLFKKTVPSSPQLIR